MTTQKQPQHLQQILEALRMSQGVLDLALCGELTAKVHVEQVNARVRAAVEACEELAATESGTPGTIGEVAAVIAKLDAWGIAPGTLVERVCEARNGPKDSSRLHDAEVIAVPSELVQGLMARALPVMEQTASAWKTRAEAAEHQAHIQGEGQPSNPPASSESSLSESVAEDEHMLQATLDCANMAARGMKPAGPQAYESLRRLAAQAQGYEAMKAELARLGAVGEAFHAEAEALEARSRSIFTELTYANATINTLTQERDEARGALVLTTQERDTAVAAHTAAEKRWEQCESERISLIGQRDEAERLGRIVIQERDDAREQRDDALASARRLRSEAQELANLRDRLERKRNAATSDNARLLELARAVESMVEDLANNGSGADCKFTSQERAQHLLAIIRSPHPGEVLAYNQEHLLAVNEGVELVAIHYDALASGARTKAVGYADHPIAREWSATAERYEKQAAYIRSMKKPLKQG